MSRVRRLERGVERIEVANLAQEDHVRVLPQHAAQRLREATRVGPDLALVDVAVDVAVQELDRVLDRDDVRAPPLVDVLDHRRERGRLPRPVIPVTSTSPRGRIAISATTLGRFSSSIVLT